MTHPHELWHHDPALLALSALLCVAGAWATSRFFRRMTEVDGVQRQAWLFLTALASGVTIWCTHFIAMLGFHAGMVVDFDHLRTASSLVVAVAGSAIGFWVAGRGSGSRWQAVAGGVIVGLAVASMHYLGMAALEIDGDIAWSAPLVALSVALAVVLAPLATYAGRMPQRRGADLMWVLFALCVLCLHFTGMGAMRMSSSMPGMDQVQPNSLNVLAVAIATLSFVTIGAGAAGYLIDDHTRASAVERFRRLAMYDVLTGLPNRASFNERLAAEIAHAGTRGTRLAMVVVDVDNFKEINDARGHSVGDGVLRELGQRMHRLADAHEGSFIARIGGDEFVALFPLGERRVLDDFLASLAHALNGPLVGLAPDVIVSRASLGVAIFPEDAADAENLVTNADLAMYRAKNDAVQQMCFYDVAVDERTRLRRGLSAYLREAVARDELFLHYQVQTSVSTGGIRGFEALVRWQHPQLGVVSPADFIPLAEETGLIVQVGEWVLRTACREAVRWEPPYRVAVNVSAVQLAQPNLVTTVREALADSGLSPERLELELTETAVFTDRERALQALHEIKELGVGIALDDFGVGYSSLDALRSFPFDRIKIDRSFFSGAGTPEQTVELVRTVLSLGRTFGMSVLAEGIETDEQLALISATGCDEAQGFLFGRPTPIDELIRAGQLRQLTA
ncbi:putative bifunctional diguanylate cyclase/phosphodiesterase [Nocardioides sp. Kera G14]|uniref:putative bifunctional diguanylate cyclase/phosphodiesterase n=1 Tax=Nocardioides sp. Kera G14 TaxID=2884264 RepID=UPI001D12C3F5|nr:EAL domain-containing protein [Nocardioides sp. Kera G14]UDY25234.1 EAL domain-containing protein [Nocardioides sp. Kera G14]